MAGNGYRLLLVLIFGSVVFPTLMMADSEETIANAQTSGGDGSTDGNSDDDVTDAAEIDFAQVNDGDAQTNAQMDGDDGSMDVNSDDDVTDPAEIDFAQNYLQQYGYYDDDDDDGGTQRSMASKERAIAAMQFTAHMPITGKLNKATLEMMHLPRCGNKDFNGPAERLRRRRRRYSVASEPWPTRSLTFRLRNFTPDMRPWAVREEIRRAFNVWSRAANINFRETHDGADIDIVFAEGSHGDGHAFDGTGGVLAHAFFPGRNRISGDAHFDDEEWFTANTSRGTNLFMVAAHELGHSLGLGHSGVKGSMMHAMYQGYRRNFGLHPDDIAGIRRLYGPRRPGTRPGPKPGPRPPKPPPGKPTTPSCDLRANALVATSQEDILGFKNSELFHFRQHRGTFILLPGFPKPISKQFRLRRGSLTTVDAAYKRYDGTLRLFSGNRYYDFTSHGHNIRRGELQQLFRGVQQSFAPTRLDAAVQVPDFNNKVFLFRGRQYWRLTDYADRTDFGYPRLISRWSGDLGSGFDAVLHFGGSVYFVTGNTYQQWHWAEREVIPPPNGQSNRVDRQFYGCGQLLDGSGLNSIENSQSSSRRIYNVALIPAMLVLTTLVLSW